MNGRFGFRATNVGVDVSVGSGVSVSVGLGVNVSVAVGELVAVAVAVGELVAVGVSVATGEPVAVGEPVGVSVLVGLGVLVSVAVAVLVGVGVFVAVGVLVWVGVFVAVGVPAWLCVKPKLTDANSPICKLMVWHWRSGLPMVRSPLLFSSPLGACNSRQRLYWPGTKRVKITSPLLPLTKRWTSVSEVSYRRTSKPGTPGSPLPN